jgi:hypothetical protein
MAQCSGYAHHCNWKVAVKDKNPLVFCPTLVPIPHSNCSQPLHDVTVVNPMSKATKADDAALPKYLWNDWLLLGLSMASTGEHIAALDVI